MHRTRSAATRPTKGEDDGLMGGKVRRFSDVDAGSGGDEAYTSYAEAESVLQDLAEVFFENTDVASGDQTGSPRKSVAPGSRHSFQIMEAKYRALVEQIPAVVFMAYLDEGVGEAYVSPQIEAALGFTQEEWLQDPVRWYSQVHPDDKQRWSVEAAELFLSGKPLRSAYRVLSRDNRVIWFHCEAKMIRARRRKPMVHSWRRIRHHRSEANGRGAGGRAQCSHCHSGYGWRIGDRARCRWPHRSLQPRL